ncbi:carbamoyl phosphate synthase large subunit [Candidatus Peregrinibacteria bacterium CG_4_10_14_0_2_um_filter_43_11]|nr:MAG: carbamoyl phosphate synthase large subunit [Candidatus Peregrinibacteria bacterium CG_4_10_14_0_2_um_filter_43_11]
MKKPSFKKILLLGSGALKIGEAGEFDYSGSQAIKAFKEEGIKVILINPNIATNQTSKGLADKIYFLPVTPYFVEQVIKKEKPDAIALSFGGQTALNCGVVLQESGVLKTYKINVLGTPVKSIQLTEDRELFNRALAEIDVRIPRSVACTAMNDAKKAATKIGFPVMIRAAFALGGLGSGVAKTQKELDTVLQKAFSGSSQVLVEEYLKGWKEIEYEVVRDAQNNCITVCNMENLDPLGIHTGESIVIAPSQTLNNHEYQKLRNIALKVIRHFGIVGECNIQYALDPKSDDYRVIEVNARLSRSSALASKATGYPLAYIAAKLGLGYSLPELKNNVTQKTSACFEPALDYVALKIPRWDLNKFRKVNDVITTEMKSVGEVMALGRTFEEVLQKGLRMIQIGAYGLTPETFSINGLEEALVNPTPHRIFALAKAFDKGYTVEKIHRLTGIDPWFLFKIKNIRDLNKKIGHCKTLSAIKPDAMRQFKQAGFSDRQIADGVGSRESSVRQYRKKLGVLPVVKQIDTLAAEFPAKTNYLYLTYNGIQDDISFKGTKKKKTIVLGSGPYCIGSSVEFDWCCVNAVKTLSKQKHEAIMINYNPETVSTDYDECDKLYFDELSLERVLDIADKEKPDGMIISMGGQIPNNLAVKLDEAGIRIMGTAVKDIDRAESRDKFSALLDRIGVDQPEWNAFSKISDAYIFANKVGYPVLVRPSYVLSGAAMRVAHNHDELEAFLGKAARINTEAPVVISKFEVGAREIEMDAVAHKGKLLIFAISEHVENAGVHSGDATIVLPPQKTYLETLRRVKTIGKETAKSLNITGPFNIQFLAKDNRIKVIECNLRASRSFPFVSKVTKYNFIEIATQAMLGIVDKNKKYQTVDLDYVGVKFPQFSFPRLKGADPVSGVEMASTGEVACFGDDLEEAFLKSYLAVGNRIPKKNILLSIGRMVDKLDMLETARLMKKQGFHLFGTEGTAKFLNENGIEVTHLHRVSTHKSPNIAEYLSRGKLGLAVIIPRTYAHDEVTDGYLIRRKAIDMNIPLITNVQVTKTLMRALEKYKIEDLKIEDWEEYRN